MQVNDLSTWDGGDWEVLGDRQAAQCQGNAFSLFGCNELIDVDRVNWLLALTAATTVAKVLPASSETSEEDVNHHGYLAGKLLSGESRTAQGHAQRLHAAAALPVISTRNLRCEEGALTGSRTASMVCP